jgi:hypothetical protein
MPAGSAIAPRRGAGADRVRMESTERVMRVGTRSRQQAT